jgi:putative ABC transport system ATP-binding protein
MHMARSQVRAPSTAAAVALTHVTRRHPTARGQTVTAIDDLSLELHAASAVAINGPSGSGKSTLLQLIGALDRPDAGTITVNDQDVHALNARDLAAYRRCVGLVLQRCNLLPALTVLDNVIAPVLPVKTTFDKPRRARELLAAVGLAGREREIPAELSTGEQQRVTIARALINQPTLILADEPTGSLDPRTARAIIDLLLDLRDHGAITLILATHDPTVASRCDRILRLVDGSLRDDIDVHAVSNSLATLNRLHRTSAH